MKYIIELSNEAKNDIQKIYDYISLTLQAPIAAKNQYKAIIKAISSLSEMPERYRLFDAELFPNINLRIVTVNNYCVLYTVNNETQIVSIARVLYGGSNIKEHIVFH